MKNTFIYIILLIILFASIAQAELSAPTINRAGARSWGTYYDLMGEIGIINGTLSLIHNITDNNGNYYLKNISILCSSNCTVIKYANGSIQIDPSGTGGGVTMDEVNASAQITRFQVTGQEGVDTGQNTSFQNSSFGIFLTNGSNALATGYFDVIQLLPVGGTITNLSIEGRYAGAMNLSLMYNATSVPVYPGDVVASINVTSGSSASSSGLNIAVAQNGNMMVYIDANSGAVNKTNLRGILRRS